MLVSTGIDLGSRREAGVPVPGVDGGVKAGLMKEFGGSWSRSKSDIRDMGKGLGV